MNIELQSSIYEKLFHSNGGKDLRNIVYEKLHNWRDMLEEGLIFRIFSN